MQQKVGFQMKTFEAKEAELIARQQVKSKNNLAKIVLL